MKKLLFGAAALAAVALIVVLLLVLRFDPDALGARVIQVVNEKSGIRLTAETMTLHPLRGLEMRGARATGRVEAGEIEARVELLRLRYRWLPVLTGNLVIDEVLMESPSIVLLTRSAEDKRQATVQGRQSARQKRSSRNGKRSAEGRTDPREEAGKVAADERSLRLSIERMSIDNGEIEVLSRDDEAVMFSVEQLALALRGLTFDPEADSSTAAVSGEGRLTTGRVVHGEIEAERAAGQIRLSAGQADLTELEVRTRNADLVIYRLILELLEEPPGYSLTAAGGLDLNGALGLEAPQGGFGRVAIDLEAAGEGPELAEVDGEGTLTLNRGAIPPIPSVVQIEELLGQPLLTGRAYQQTEIDYRLRDNRVELSPFEIVGDGARLGGQGVIDLAGPLDLEIFVRLPRRSLDEDSLGPEELDEAEDDDGMVTIPFEVGGTVDEPEVQLTWDGVKALARDAAESWAEKALEEATKRAAEWLRSQSGTEDDN